MLRLFLALCFAFAMGNPVNFPMGPKAPPLPIRVDDCCTKDLLHYDHTDIDLLKECLQMDVKPNMCDREICIATKKSFASSDGTIDKKVLQELVEKDFKDNTVALEGILENCINGDVSKFGKEDFCDLMKMNICIVLQVAKSCDDWKESEDCKKLKSWFDPLI